MPLDLSGSGGMLIEFHNHKAYIWRSSFAALREVKFCQGLTTGYYYL